MGFLTILHTDWVDGEDRLVVKEVLKYYDEKTQTVFCVPPGFYTDGSSIPKQLWSLIGGHPFSYYLRAPGTLHDKLYFSGEVSRGNADRIFRQAIQSVGGSTAKAMICWLGVRVGGWVAWGNYRRIQNEKSSVSPSAAAD
jgi:hypothetical protein